MRLIDADAIVVPSDFRVEHFHDRIEDKVAYDLGCAVRELLDEQTTVDAVEVVRCKDCENWGTRAKTIDNEGNTISCDCIALDGMTKPDFYCAWGVKK